jgi:hypothetical protein
MCVAGKPIKISEIFVSKEILALKSHQALAWSQSQNKHNTDKSLRRGKFFAGGKLQVTSPQKLQVTSLQKLQVRKSYKIQESIRRQGNGKF